MFDEKTILARLQNGEDTQKIANEMTALLNETNKMHLKLETERRAKLEEEKKKKEAANKQKQKEESFNDIYELFKDWVKTYYDKKVYEEFEKLKSKDFVKILDLCSSINVSVSDLDSSLELLLPLFEREKKGDALSHDLLKTLLW